MVIWEKERTGAMDDFLGKVRCEVTCAGTGRVMAASEVLQ